MNNDNNQQIPGQQIFEYDQGYTKADLEMIVRYNKACEKLCLIAFKSDIASQLHQTHVFTEALLEHLKNGKKPSFYQAWDELVEQLPDKLKPIVLESES